jgi:uncharacterized repeat protein (TIGR01451 family)
VLTYTLVIRNIGDGWATNIVLSDAIPANTTYVTESITLNGGAQSDALGDDYADYNLTSAGKVTVKPPTMQAGDFCTITFQVTIK